LIIQGNTKAIEIFLEGLEDGQIFGEGGEFPGKLVSVKKSLGTISGRVL
jgi:hypothetical protein